MQAAVPAARLLGRSRECAVLDHLLASVRAGPSRALVLRGEPGVGKSALLEYLVRSASDCAVARAAGVESEMELAYAGLQQLCAPFADRLERLPGPQRDALRTAFGLRDGNAPDRYLVGLAALSLLSDVAEARPLVCIVDDAQWLDAASAQGLAFVARRLGAESLGLVFAMREPGGDKHFERLQELAVGGLDDGDAQELLAGVVAGPLDERVRDRIVAETRGNPLALLELPRGRTPAELAGGFGLSDVPPLSGRIEHSFRERLARLPRSTRLLLLVAAADPVGDPVLVWGAAAELGIGPDAAPPATAAGLVDFGAQVRFGHPLVRSAVKGAASSEERQRVHRALAEATDAGIDPDRRAWHLAHAAAGLDEDLAAELGRSAGRARARGGLAAEAAFHERSVELTPDPRRRAQRALLAAQSKHQAGAPDAALRLLAVAQAGPLGELDQARAQLLHAQITFVVTRGRDAPPLLLEAARRLEVLDPRLAQETYLEAWSSALFAGRLASAGSLDKVSREALSAPPPATPGRPAEALLEGFSLAFTEGRATAAPFLQRAANGFAGTDVSAEEVLRWGWLATAAAVMAWDYETCLAVATRGVQVARQAGALTVLAVSVNVLAQAAALGGEFGRATLLVGEADSVTEATGARVAPYGALLLGGLRGREDHASTLIDATLREFTADGQGTAVQYAWWARSLLLNGLGRYQEALAAAAEASEDTPELFVAVWAAIEELEAATRTDNRQAADRALARIVAATAVAQTDWASGIRARSRALVSDGEAAERLHREAIDRLGRTRLRPELARTHLLYGEWLRRENRRVDAREQLRLAHTMLADVGMEAFAERARRELLATGETVRKRTVETLDELTPQEIQVARLAADGHTNPEIGAQLFLSPRTIEWHLTKVFGKLGIGSRKELRTALSDVGAVSAAA